MIFFVENIIRLKQFLLNRILSCHIILLTATLKKCNFDFKKEIRFWFFYHFPDDWKFQVDLNVDTIQWFSLPETRIHCNPVFIYWVPLFPLPSLVEAICLTGNIQIPPALRLSSRLICISLMVRILVRKWKGEQIHVENW